MILIVNLAALYFVYLIISREKTSILDFVPVWVVGVIGLGFALGHAVFLGYKDRYRKIVSEFSKESREEEHRRNVWAVWYAAISYFSLLGFGAALTILR